MGPGKDHLSRPELPRPRAGGRAGRPGGPHFLRPVRQLADRPDGDDRSASDHRAGRLRGRAIFGVAETIAFLSQIMTLEPGDIIATGTPAGVGMSRDPQLFLRSGDVVEVEIDGIGTLRNPVA
ncbi:MAG: fumarylacetoacetate hydrolase family protein [Solirubrobacterales bacterium]|nr:fumarylacetoacetate hydrolase family protein [Solirubrobacterales bacterium]